MLRNEINSASWKFGLLFIIVLVALTQMPTPYEEIVRNVEIERRFMEEEIMNIQETEGMSEREAREMYGPGPVSEPEDIALNELSGLYVNFGMGPMVGLGGLLGIGLVSSEVGSGTILSLLSRPVSRRRIFLTKYLTGVVFLFVAALLGMVGIFSFASLRGYPFDEVTWGGIVLAVLLAWFVGLFVLGIALLVSVLTRNVMQSLLVTAAAVFALIALPTLGVDLVSSIFFDYNYDADWQRIDAINRISDGLTLSNYWPDMTYFWPGGREFSIGYYTFFGNSRWGDFGVTLVAAMVPVCVAYWLFGRKKF